MNVENSAASYFCGNHDFVEEKNLKLDIINVFCNIIIVFTGTFYQLNVSLLK